MKNLCIYLLLNKVSSNVDTTSALDIEDLLVPSICFVTIFSLTCFISILIYNNSIEQPKELIKKLDTRRYSNEFVNTKCSEYLNNLNDVEGEVIELVLSNGEVIDDEISKTDVYFNISENITSETLKLAKKQVFLERSTTYDYKGINNYLTGIDKNNLPFIKTESINKDICERLVEIESYLNVSKSIRDIHKSSSKDYMFFFENQNIIAQNIKNKEEIYKTFQNSFRDEAQYYMLQYKGEAIAYVIENGLFLV